MNKETIPYVKPKPKKVDWDERKAARKKLFVWFAKILIVVTLFDILLISLPILLAAPALGTAVMLGIAPMLMVALSWAIPCWLFFDKPLWLYGATFGTMPLRVVLVVTYVSTMVAALALNPLTLIMAMMMHWVLFMIPELCMVVKLGNMPMTAEVEPNE